jgi:protein-tyrosine-phosphatase
MPTILFVCTANRYRSPIAEAYFKSLLARQNPSSAWKIHSAGTWTEDGLPPMSRAVEDANQLGLDIREHRSRVVSEALLEEANLILVMESGQKEGLQIEFPASRSKTHLLSEIVTGDTFDVPDPARYPRDKTAIPGLITLLENGFDQIIARAQA